MRIYNSYILSLTFILLLTAVILTAAGGSALKYFFPVFVLEAIIITELFVYLNSKARQRLTFVSAVLLGGFLVYLTVNLAAILGIVL